MALASRSSSAYKLQPTPKPSKKVTINHKRKNKKKKKSAKFKIAAVIFSVFAIQLFLCYRWVALYDLHSEIENKNSELISLQRENEQKAIAIDRVIDSSKVEEYAVNQLGMQKIDSNQIVYIKPAHGDSMQKIVHRNSRPQKRNVFGAISVTIGGLLEYLK